MFTVSATPLRVYNESQPAPERKTTRHWRQHAMIPRTSHVEHSQSVNVQELHKKLEKYEKANDKLKMLAGWNLRSVKSALKDVQELMEILEDFE